MKMRQLSKQDSFMSTMVKAAVVALAVVSASSGADAQSLKQPILCPDDIVPCKLSGTMPEGINVGVLGLWLSPDGQRAVYVSDQSGTLELYSVPVGGGHVAPDQLNRPVTDDFNGVGGIVVISPDSTRVLYTMKTSDGRHSLFSVPITGPASASVRLSSDVSGPVGVQLMFQISPDSRTVVFAPTARDQLRAVPIDGPANAGVRLTDPFVADGVVTAFDLSANSHSVVYIASQDDAQTDELFRVPLTLSPPPDPMTTKLNAPLTAGGEVTTFELAPNSEAVVYRADQDTDEVAELYRTSLGGAQPVKLSRPLPPDWAVNDKDLGSDSFEGFAITPDSRRVVYQIGISEPKLLQELYSVPLDGLASDSLRIDRNTDPVPDGRPFEFKMSANGAWVVYQEVVQTPTAPDQFWLFSVPAAGPASASKPLTFPTTVVAHFTLSPDSSRVVHNFISGSAPATLLSTPIDNPDGGVVIDGPENPDGAILINAASTRVVYREVASTLFSAALDGTGARYNLTEPLPNPLSIRIALSSSAFRIVYEAKQGRGGPVEIYSSRLAPASLPSIPVRHKVE